MNQETMYAAALQSLKAAAAAAYRPSSTSAARRAGPGKPSGMRICGAGRGSRPRYFPSSDKNETFLTGTDSSISWISMASGPWPCGMTTIRRGCPSLPSRRWSSSVRERWAATAAASPSSARARPALTAERGGITGCRTGGPGLYHHQRRCRGIDTRAHRGALKGKGRTVIVAANGLDRTYPRENKALFRQVVDNGGASFLNTPSASSRCPGISRPGTASSPAWRRRRSSSKRPCAAAP